MIGILKPTKADTEPQDWTPQEIERAKQLSRKLIVQLFDEGKCSPVFYVCENSGYVMLSLEFGIPCMGIDDIYARPSGTDHFNKDIGECVCLCKAANTPIPEFIKNKNREAK